MTGDNILVWDDGMQQFFAGWNHKAKVYMTDKPKPLWSKTVKGARVSRSLGAMQMVAKQLGSKARVVSETRARNLEAIAYYSEEARKPVK